MRKATHYTHAQKVQITEEKEGKKWNKNLNDTENENTRGKNNTHVHDCCISRLIRNSREVNYTYYHRVLNYESPDEAFMLMNVIQPQ